MTKRRLIKTIKREGIQMMPNVLDNVYRELKLEATPKIHHRLPLWLLPLTSALAFGALVTTIIVSSLNQAPIVSYAEASVRLQIVAASLINTEPPAGSIKFAPVDPIIPTFSYKVNIHGKTKALDNKRNNALNAENEPAKIIAAGLALTETVDQDPVQLAVSLTRLARQTGYLESYEVGNMIRYFVHSDDSNYKRRLKTEIDVAIETYLKTELIYAIAEDDDTMDPPDFSDYHDFSEELDEYRDSFDNKRQDHEDDDDKRGPNWGEDIDDWMDRHHGDSDDDDEDSSSNSNNSNHRPRP